MHRSYSILLCLLTVSAGGSAHAEHGGKIVYESERVHVEMNITEKSTAMSNGSVKKIDRSVPQPVSEDEDEREVTAAEIYDLAKKRIAKRIADLSAERNKLLVEYDHILSEERRYGIR